MRDEAGAWRLILLAAILVLLAPGQAHAYIGPGAGFAAGRVVLRRVRRDALGLLAFITWPVRLLWRTLFGWRRCGRAGSSGW